MSILVINSSMNRDGLTVSMVTDLLGQRDYGLCHLNDYQIDQLGQVTGRDQLAELMALMHQYDTILFATPIYWFDMTGSMKLFLERVAEENDWQHPSYPNHKAAILAQGYAPGAKVLKFVEHIISQVAGRLGMDYIGMVTKEEEYERLRELL